jgi:SAM-dependent methyltransferase
MDKNKPSILADKDLSETQIYVTTQTYDRFAKEYADKWEWNQKTIKEIEKYNIKPFQKLVAKGSNVLIVGSRTGRDYSLLTKAGYQCLGVEPSFGFLAEAVKRVKGGLFIRLDLRDLPFMPESFEAIYADALTHIPKKDLGDTLKDFRIFLVKKGFLYLSLKLGKSGLLVDKSIGGKRFMTLYSKEEIVRKVERTGFSIVWSEESSHTDPSHPRWLSLMLKKQ